MLNFQNKKRKKHNQKHVQDVYLVNQFLTQGNVGSAPTAKIEACILILLITNNFRLRHCWNYKKTHRTNKDPITNSRRYRNSGNLKQAV